MLRELPNKNVDKKFVMFSNEDLDLCLKSEYVSTF